MTTDTGLWHDNYLSGTHYTASKMTYIVSGGALNYTHSLTFLVANSHSDNLEISAEKLLFRLAYDCSVHVWRQPYSVSACEVMTIRRFVNHTLLLLILFCLFFTRENRGG